MFSFGVRVIFTTFVVDQFDVTKQGCEIAQKGLIYQGREIVPPMVKWHEVPLASWVGKGEVILCASESSTLSPSLAIFLLNIFSSRRESFRETKISLSFSHSFTWCQFPEMSNSSAGGTGDNTVLKSCWNQFLHQLLLMIVLPGISLVSWKLLGATQAPHSHAMA